MKKQISRRDFIKDTTVALGTIAVYSQIGGSVAMAEENALPQVFFTKDISAEGVC